MTQTATGTDQRKQFFDDQGYWVAKGLFTAEAMAELGQTFTQHVADGPDPRMCDGHQLKLPDDPLSRYPRLMHPHRWPETAVGKLAMAYLLNPALREVLEALAGEEMIAAQSMFYFKPAGSRGQDLHQDNFYLRVKPGTCLAAWIAVDDADRDNGGMVVVPGSQGMEVVCPSQADPSVSFSTAHVEPPAGLSEEPMDLKAGDVLFFNGSVIHGSYPNTSKDRFRRALINHYVPLSCREVAGSYHPLLNFAGEVVSREAATGGGPCGDVVKAM